MNNGQHPPAPAESYPRAVYAADRHITPDTVSVEASETTLILWLAGIMVGVPRDADDTRLQASLHLAWHLSQTAERFGALVRAELEQRQRERTAAPIAAAMRAASHARLAPSAPAAPATGDVLAQQAAPPGARYCTGCGNQLRPVTPEETAAAATAAEPADTRRDCPHCRVEFLADQVRARAEHTSSPPAPAVLAETGLMPVVADATAHPNGDHTP
ncbi:hypothetical protein [Nonomuraea sp. 10N515B]|uniref:hypothetical protein n=1 Tax=Nonomuraea sp. 10N515B TaxID=3457422 RepID=UPI003FCE51CE